MILVAVMLSSILIAAPGASNNNHVQLTMSLGEEWDSNAARTLNLSSLDKESDLLTRVIGELKWAHIVNPSNSLVGTVLGGAKRFHSQQSEDVIVHNISLGSRHKLSPKWKLGTDVRFRMTRMRSVLRDYSLAQGDLRLDWLGIKSVESGLTVSAKRFMFPTETRLSYYGGSVTLGFSGKLSEHMQWRTTGTYERDEFGGNALTTVFDPNNNQMTVTFCDEEDSRFLQTCMSQPRQDDILVARLGLFYQRFFLLRGNLFFERRRSNSVYEDINRVGLTVSTTLEMFAGIMLNALASIQYTSEQSLSQNLYQFQPEDDENQNRITLQLSREIISQVDLLVRYEYFSNAFATSDTLFTRQTAFVGLRFDTQSS
ncbi:MAG: hypothetical protein VYC39_00555 [Myxococcota bacterium]|nr:hypothetical protein [Myxococcota bacterium]